MQEEERNFQRLETLEGANGDLDDAEENAQEGAWIPTEKRLFREPYCTEQFVTIGEVHNETCHRMWALSSMSRLI